MADHPTPSEVETEDDYWEIQSVLIDKHVGEETAREQADQIVEKIED